MYAQIIIPVPIPKIFSYRIGEEHSIKAKVGLRVLVEFGRSKIYAGIIASLREPNDLPSEVKEVIGIMDEHPIVTNWQLDLWQWMADYYMCSIGEVMQAALPSSFLLKSESFVYAKNMHVDTTLLSHKERLLFEALRNQEKLSLNDIGPILKLKNPKPFINKQVEKGLIYLSENISKKYKAKSHKVFTLSNEIEEKDLESIFEGLEKRAFKQLLLLMKFVELNRPFGERRSHISKTELLKRSNSSSAVLKGLVDKNILIESEIEIGRFKHNFEHVLAAKALEPEQDRAFRSIKKKFNAEQNVLLHGVTGSGKTEIYIHLMKETIAKGKKVLYLLPEIALTTQLVQRLQFHFGDKIATFHSFISSLEKYEIWNDLLVEKYRSFDVVIGARSALFMPMKDLGLIIVDEEHDGSFKQHDPAPRYNARDAAMKLGSLVNAKVLLGSATPSIETQWLASIGQIGSVNLNKRFGDAEMPTIEIVDLKKDVKKKGDQNMFSFKLRDEIGSALERKEQIILFQNRRGYVPYWHCQTCGHNPECDNCDVSLTYHKNKHKLLCHYCGNNYDPPSFCEKCESTDLRMVGFGTEKIEDELQDLFPDARIKRMDHDTTRGKNGHQKIIDLFEKKDIDILVGTQMVTKGLDFENVSLVGIISADSIVSWPDFRSNERAFQVMTQVSGRAGRKDKKGKVLIQTRQPELQVFQQVIQNDHSSFYQEEIQEREQFNYPPFYRIIKFIIKHPDIHKTDQSARYFALLLKNKFGNRVLGPQPAIVSRIKRLYIQEIILKTERNASRKAIREKIDLALSEFRATKNWNAVRIIIDVDPV